MLEKTGLIPQAFTFKNPFYIILVALLLFMAVTYLDQNFMNYFINQFC